MALISGKGSGLLVGLGVVIAAPILLPVLARAARPLAKLAVRGVMTVSDYVSETAAHAHEQMKDLVAEVEAERKQAAEEKPGGPAGEQATSKPEASRL